MPGTASTILNLLFAQIYSFLSALRFLPSKVPDRAPPNMQVWTPHSTALEVSWDDVPDAHKNGIIRGCKVRYTEITENGSSVIKDLPAEQRSLRIVGLNKYTLYNITVLAYTSKGDGNLASKVLMTDQDGMYV